MKKIQFAFRGMAQPKRQNTIMSPPKINSPIKSNNNRPGSPSKANNSSLIKVTDQRSASKSDATKKTNASPVTRRNTISHTTLSSPIKKTLTGAGVSTGAKKLMLLMKRGLKEQFKRLMEEQKKREANKYLIIEEQLYNELREK